MQKFIIQCSVLQSRVLLMRFQRIPNYVVNPRVTEPVADQDPPKIQNPGRSGPGFEIETIVCTA
jgi:hypothetical protein